MKKSKLFQRIFLISIILRVLSGWQNSCLYYEETNKMIYLFTSIYNQNIKNITVLDKNGRKLSQCLISVKLDIPNCTGLGHATFISNQNALGIFEMSLYINRSSDQYLYKNVSLLVDNQTFNINSFTGSVEESNLHLTAIPGNNRTAIVFVCSACFPIRYNQAEFYIQNATSETHISAFCNNENKQCTNNHNINCTCGNNGKLFTIKLPFLHEAISLKCNIRLNVTDTDKDREACLYYNGREFTPRCKSFTDSIISSAIVSDTTEVDSQTSTGAPTKSHTDTTEPNIKVIVSIVIAGIFFLIILVAIITWYYVKKRKATTRREGYVSRDGNGTLELELVKKENEQIKQENKKLKKKNEELMQIK